MIVVEGPDGAGKTTLVERLCEEFGLVVGERGTSNRDELYKVTFPDTMRALAEAVISPDMDEDKMSKSQRPIVWDRLFFSDFVYAPIQNRPVAFGPECKMFVLNMLEALKAPIIYCRPPQEVILSNVEDEDKHQMEGVRENVDKMIHTYDQLLRHSKGHLNLIEYDYTEPGAHYLVFAQIEAYMSLRKEQRRHELG